jgi:membrane-associated phospholipid phosphatase
MPAYRKIDPRKCAMAALGGFVIVAVLTLRAHGVREVDRSLLADAHSLDTGPVHSAAEYLRWLGGLVPQVVLVAGAVVVGLRRGLIHRAVGAAFVVCGAVVTTEVLKHLVADERHPTASWYLAGEHTFPSGHTATFTSLTFAYLFVVPVRFRPVAALVGGMLTLSVAVAMVVLHRHWPSDAIGGLLMGCAWGFAVIAVLDGLASN